MDHIEYRPQILQPVLDRSAGHCQLEARVERLGGARHLTGGILELLDLVIDDDSERLPGETQMIVAHRFKGRQHHTRFSQGVGCDSWTSNFDVASAAVPHPLEAGSIGIDDRTERIWRQMTLDLGSPVGKQTCRSHDKDWLRQSLF